MTQRDARPTMTGPEQATEFAAPTGTKLVRVHTRHDGRFYGPPRGKRKQVGFEVTVFPWQGGANIGRGEGATLVEAREAAGLRPEPDVVTREKYDERTGE